MTVDLTALEQVPDSCIPAVLGELERVRSLLWARLARVRAPVAPETRAEASVERLLTARSRRRFSPHSVWCTT